MKKNIFIITAVVFLTAFIVGSGVFVLQKKTGEKNQNEAVENTKQEMQVYRNEKYGYEINFPGEWMIENNSQVDVALFYSERVDLEEDGSESKRADLMISAHALTSETEINDFIKQEMTNNHAVFYESKKLGDNNIDVYRDAGYPDTYGSEIYSYIIQEGKNVYVISALYKQQIFDIISTFNSLQIHNQEENEEIDMTDWQIYKNEKYGFELKYPEDWDMETRESALLFASNGPIGDSFGFLAQEKIINDSPFWVNISVVEDVQCEDALAYFDFAHRGDIVVYDGYETIQLGDKQNDFFRITEKGGSYISYIKVKNGNFYEISFSNYKIDDDLYRKVEKLIHTFNFDTADPKTLGAEINNVLPVKVEDQNKIYSNADYGFTVKYPKTWIIFQEDTENSTFSDSFVIRADKKDQYGWPFWLHIKLIENADGYVIKEDDPYEIAYVGEKNEWFRKLETQKSIYYERGKDDVLYALFFRKSGIEDLDNQAENIISNFDFIKFNVVRPNPVPVGVAGEDYTIEFLIEGGTPPYSISYRDVWKKYDFCSALTQNEDDNLTTAGSGVETEAGSCVIDVTVQDSNGQDTQFLYPFSIE